MARPLFLKPSQAALLHWAARGETSAETAQVLHLSEATGNFYLQRVMTKRSASNRQQAVAFATAMGMFSTGQKTGDARLSGQTA